MANVDANRHSRLQPGDRALRVPANTALLLIDVQQAIDDPQWTTEGPRNNPQAERNLASLLATWRHVNYPILLTYATTRPFRTRRTVQGNRATNSKWKRDRLRASGLL